MRKITWVDDWILYALNVVERNVRALLEMRKLPYLRTGKFQVRRQRPHRHESELHTPCLFMGVAYLKGKRTFDIRGSLEVNRYPYGAEERIIARGSLWIKTPDEIIRWAFIDWEHEHSSRICQDGDSSRLFSEPRGDISFARKKLG